MMEEKIIIAGFGGQGALAIGQLLTYSGMIENKNVSWVPSYGPEMRGGTANCSVTVSDAPVGSPVVTEATSAIVMNLPSFAKFEPMVVPGGNLFVNASLCDSKSERTDIKVFYIHANEEAEKIGNAKVANMIMLGAFLEATKAVEVEDVLNKAFLAVFHEKKMHLLPINKQALERGMEIAREQM